MPMIALHTHLQTGETLDIVKECLNGDHTLDISTADDTTSNTATDR